MIEGSTKSGGGTQGREVKMKATKKKYMKGKGDQGGDSDEEEVSKSRGVEIQFMSMEEMAEELKKQPELRDCPEDFIMEIATQIHRWGTIYSLEIYLDLKCNIRLLKICYSTCSINKPHNFYAGR